VFGVLGFIVAFARYGHKGQLSRFFLYGYVLLRRRILRDFESFEDYKTLRRTKNPWVSSLQSSQSDVKL
jgi:hypothetical protein